MKRWMLAMHRSMALPFGARRSMLFVCCVGLFWLVSPSAAAAEPPLDAPRQAQSLFDAGLKRKDAGQAQAACELFEASVLLSPSPHGWLQVGVCHEALDPVGALASFEAALAAAAAVPDAARRTAYESAARERIEQLLPVIPTITFRRSPTVGVSVDMTPSLRDLSVPVEVFDEPLRFNPGRYRVRAWALGRVSYVADLDLGAGQRHVVALPALVPSPESSRPASSLPGPSLPESGSPLTVASGAPYAEAPFTPEPAAPAAARDASGSRFGALPAVLVGGGGALVALGIVSGQLSSSARDELRRECTAPDAQGHRRCGSDQADNKRRLERFALAADVLWISGVLLAGTGITLFVIDRDVEATSQVMAGCFSGGCGLSATGRF
jgi:hypothetical protein